MKVPSGLFALAVAGLTATAAHANPSSAPVSSAPSLALTISQVSAGLASIVPASPANTRYESIRYRPRYRPRRYDERSSSSGSSSGYLQLQGGVFDPTGDNVANGSMFGMRVGTSADDRVQLGMQIDWAHRSDRQTEVVGSGTLPGGGTVERRRELSSASSDLLPLMAFVQVSPTGTNQGPYVGLAGGYEALFISAEDFATGENFDATYDGWGWQFYGGFAFPMSNVTRLTVEGYTNAGDLDRKVVDPTSGITYREVVDAGGVGIRGGVSWSF
jgi:hypothetical protein